MRAFFSIFLLLPVIYPQVMAIEEVDIVINEINTLLREKNHVEKTEQTSTTMLLAHRQMPSSLISDVNITFHQAEQALLALRAEMFGIGNTDAEKRVDSKSTVKRWDFPIKFTFTNTQPGSNQYTEEEKEIIREGISWWESSTCVSFVEYPDDVSIGNSPHLRIIKGSGCLTNIGAVSESYQDVILGPDCIKPGVAAHEIGHALGLNHEFTRPDRDNYVRINFASIITRDFYAFNKDASSPVGYPSTPYDPTSVMHYGSMLPVDEWLKKRIIETIDPYQLTSIGQRTELSFLDVKRINSHYDCVIWSCSGVPLTQPCQNGGYQDPKHCARCRCPLGLNGDFCELISCGGTINVAPCSTAVITSPGYPGRYPPESSCSWVVNTTAQGLIFGFEGQPDLPCTTGDTCLDYVEIRDNISQLDVPGNRFCRCGKTAGRIAVADGGPVFVYFHSVAARFGGGNHAGFKLNVFATCGNVSASDFTRDCKIAKSGYDYEGSMAVGDSGRHCLAWSSQTVHQAIYFPDNSLLEAENYCRNPNSDVAPWCYSNTEDMLHSDFCTNVPSCENVPTHFESAKTKQHLSDTTPSPSFSGALLNKFSSFRFNPLNILAKWTKKVTNKPDHQIVTTSVPQNGCRKTVRGTDYLGKLNVTRYGRLCQPWSDQWPHSHSFTKDSMFPDGSVSVASNYCRNPDPWFLGGVWCLTSDKFVRWEICDVPLCALDNGIDNNKRFLL